MALASSEVCYEHREILLRDKPKPMLDASPKGTVPVFITEDGQVIDESLDLMRWALNKSDPSGWLDHDRQRTHALIAANDGPFKHHLDRYKYASRYKDDAARGDVDLSHRSDAEHHIRTLEALLAEGPYLFGAKQSLADIAIFPFIRQFANTDRDWWDSADFPRTQKWLEHHLASKLFKSIMAKHPLWSDDQSTSDA